MVYNLLLLCIKNEHNYYRDQYCIEKLCEDLMDQTMKVINYKKKEMILLTDEETGFYERQKVCNMCKKRVLY